MTKNEIVKQLKKISDRQINEAQALLPALDDNFSREAVNRLADETANEIWTLINRIEGN